MLVPLGVNWPGADVDLQVTGRRWTGIKQGRGRLRGYEVDVEAGGRGAAARPVRRTVHVSGDQVPSTIDSPRRLRAVE